jgi:hypothetical protein
LNLSFRNAELAHLCNRHAALSAWGGDDAAAIEQLLNELDCADCLGRIEQLPHVQLRRAPRGRVVAEGADDAGLLLAPLLRQAQSFRDADAAVILAVAVGDEEFNPEGASWPRLSAISRTIR